jgi:thiamine biosynthesis lipoprotein
MKNLLICFLGILALTACSTSGLLEERLDGYAQGSTYHITYLKPAEVQLERGIDSILNAVDESVSTYERGSLISQVNRGDTVKPDAIMLAMLRQSKDVYRQTKGAFDPTVGSLVQFWGFGPKKLRTADSSKVDSLLRYSGLNQVLWSKKRFYLPANFQLDCNAIAQGYTVDLIAEYLEKKGLENYLVEVGGEVRCKGANLKGDVWRIGIDKPVSQIDQQNRFQAIVKLDGVALATSGNYRKFWVDEETGTRYAHTLNPKTGFPARNRLLSASVVAPTAALADAYATAFMVMGQEKAQAFLVSTQLDLEAYLISASSEDSTWTEYKTPGFAEIILNPERE